MLLLSVLRPRPAVFGTATWRLPTRMLSRYSQHMALSERRLINALCRTPFVDLTELAHILGEPHATVHRTLADLLAEGIVGRASHGTAHLPSSQRYHLTAQGVRETADSLGFDTPSDFVRACPMSSPPCVVHIRLARRCRRPLRPGGGFFPQVEGDH